MTSTDTTVSARTEAARQAIAIARLQGAEDPNPTEIVELDGIADGSIDVDVACAVVFAKYTRG